MTDLRRAAAIAAIAAYGCSGADPHGTMGAGGASELQASGGSSGTPAASEGGSTTTTETGGTSPSGSGGTALGAGGSSADSSAGGGDSGAEGAHRDAGTDANGGDSGDPSDASPVRYKPPCLKDPNQLIMYGDSYVNWITHTFPADMNTAASLTIADFAIGGTSMGSGGIGLIPPQFDTALQTHPIIQAVIMDGGGNDVLVPDTTMFPNGAECKANGAQSPSIPDCQNIVQTALDAGNKLFLHMADSGVKDAMFFFYPKVPTGTWLAADPNGMLAYALPKIKAECDGAYDTSVKANSAKPIRCHFIDMVPVFDGHPEYFATNDLHPNPTGSKAMAAAVWSKMTQDCVAQPVSSGCCDPD